MVNYLSFDISAEKTHKGTAFLSNKQTFVRNLLIQQRKRSNF